MTIAIVGSGAIGSALARRFAAKGLGVQIANSRGAASIQPLVQELGDVIWPVELDQALAAEIVLFAAPFAAAPVILGQVPDWKGRIVVDATNAINFTNFTPTDLGGRLSSEVVAEAAVGARLVKGFNTLPAAVLAAAPEFAGGHRVLFLAGDDDNANKEISRLATALGFFPVILGKIAEGGRLQQFGGALITHNLIKIG